MSTNIRSITDKLGTYGQKFWLTLLIASIVVFAANYAASTYYSSQENQARALSSELQVLSQKLAKYSKESGSGNADSFAEFKKVRRDLRDSVLTLEDPDKK